MTAGERSSLGRYRIVRRLGAGAMGEVYLAEDPHIDRQLALKTVRLGDGGAIEIEERRVRLMREAKAAGKLVHPYIVTLFDAGEAEDGVFYLAFEFVGGPDLAARQRLQPPLTLGEVLRIGRQAAEGLDAAHRQGIVHRDIKPSNIMLDNAGTVKIGDFGIAKMLGQATELTQTGSVVGSPHYLSPEQIRGEELDGRSDLFSLGVVLYELLTRTRPFSGETITTLVYQILAREPLPIAGMRPGLPERVERVVSRLLSKERDQRFASGRELADELAACERELPREVLESPAAAVPDEMGDTVRMASTGAAAVPPPPPGAAGARPATGATELWQPSSGSGQVPLQATGPTQRWAPPPPPPGAAAAAAPAPAVSPSLAAAGAAIPGSGSYAPAAPPKRFPWGIVAVLGILALLGAGGVLGGLFWLRSSGQGAATQQAQQAPAQPDAEPGGAPADGPGVVPAATSAPLPAATFPPATFPPVQGPIADQGAGPAGNPFVKDDVAAAPPAPAEPPARVAEPPAPPRREPATQPADPAPAPAPRRQEPRPAPVETPRSRPAEPPAAADPPPPPAAPELPEPVSEQRFDREMASSLAIKFDVEPPETIVSVKREGDRRFTVIGRVAEFDAGKKKLPAYDLNGPGVHYVRLFHEGREVIYRLQASQGPQITTITFNLAPSGRRR